MVSARDLRAVNAIGGCRGRRPDRLRRRDTLVSGQGEPAVEALAIGVLAQATYQTWLSTHREDARFRGHQPPSREHRPQRCRRNVPLGQDPDELALYRAKQIAAGVLGVKRVVNEMELERGGNRGGGHSGSG